MNRKRPVNLALGTIKFPPMAIVSITHRLSGLLLAVIIPIMLYLMTLSLKSQASFDEVLGYVHHPLSKFCIWICLSALLYHLLAGIRHMIMDLGWGESAATARMSSKLLIVLAVIVSLFVGGWLW